MKLAKQITVRVILRDGDHDVPGWVFAESDPLAVTEISTLTRVTGSGQWSITHRRTGTGFQVVVWELSRAAALQKLDEILALNVDWGFGNWGQDNTKGLRKSSKWRAARDAVQNWAKLKELG